MFDISGRKVLQNLEKKLQKWVLVWFSCRDLILPSLRSILVNEIWTTLAANGQKGPFFVRTKNLKLAASNVFEGLDDAYLSYVPKLRDSSKKDMAPAERGMYAYLFYMVKIAGFLKDGDILLFDGEASFRTPGVRKMMTEFGIVPIVIEPSSLHQLLSPADNSFHSLFKISYYRLLSNQNRSAISEVEKLKLAYTCYHAIESDSIISMFRRCGLLPTEEDLESVVLKLMSEGICAIGKSRFHRKSLQMYLKWCGESNNISCCSSITPELLRLVGLLK